MADWAAFAGIAIAVLILLLGLSRLSARGTGPSVGPADRSWLDGVDSDADHLTVGEMAPPGPQTGDVVYPTGWLVLNVALSQGLFAGLLVAGAVLTGVPAVAVGLDPATLGAGLVVVGGVAGIGLAGVNTVAGRLAARAGHDPGAELGELLAPTTWAGWAALLGVALPIVAVFEELLFRGVLVGAFAAGFGLSPWLLVVLSSIAFALGHSAQGPLGMAVTGGLGLALGGVFVLTGSLVVVVVAHYLVNVVELVRRRAGWPGAS